MIHRHLRGSVWSLMAIESLLERGKLPDWREFAGALRSSRAVAVAALQVCQGPVDPGSAELARALVFHLYPDLRPGSLPPRLPAIPAE